MEKLVASEKKGGKILKVIENWGIRSKRVYNTKFSIRSATLWKRNALFIVIFLFNQNSWKKGVWEKYRSDDQER